jgi:hypothetical protein
MPCGKQHQDKCGYAIEQSSGHRRSNFCWIKFFGVSVYLTSPVLRPRTWGIDSIICCEFYSVFKEPFQHRLGGP